MTFKDENRALQELARELQLVRSHNKAFKDGDPQHDILMFAESALVCLVLEHFVRIVVGDLAPPEASLHNLLDLAVSKRLLLLPWHDQADGIRRVCRVRNTLLHGNYAQAAREAGKSSVAEFFKTTFASELERMFDVADYVMRQIDPMTGKPVRGAGGDR